jgi:predicted component of type VI protein secretion system
MPSADSKDRIYTFFMVKQSGKPDRILVWDTPEISVGRSPENDLAVEDGELSRRHAVFSRLNEACVVRNLSTSNGTFVNGEAIETQTLRLKDVVKVAGIEFTYYRIARNPVTLGMKVEYASQLKRVGPAQAQGERPDATILGLADVVPTSDGSEEDAFQVGPAGEFAYDLHGMEVKSPRNLDLELDEVGLEDLDLPPKAPAKAAAGAKREEWALDDAEPSSAVSLNLEIEGLTRELRAAVQSLLGKVIELPRLRIRLKGLDLD